MDDHADNRTLKRATAALAVALLLVLIAFAAGGVLDRIARDESRGTAERIRASRIAVRLQPFSERAETTLAIAEARHLLDSGKIQAAYELLLPLSTVVRGDPLYTATYQEAVRLKWPIDARKAHQQHAREGKGGELAPEDVEL